jgi:hypothetical protein
MNKLSRGPLHTRMTTIPHPDNQEEVIAVDIMGPIRGSMVFIFVLVVIDRFSRYVWTFLYLGSPSARDILSNFDSIHWVQGIFGVKS